MNDLIDVLYDLNKIKRKFNTDKPNQIELKLLENINRDIKETEELINFFKKDD